jgi:hypothetical protein
MRKIKVECGHDYTCNINIQGIRQIGEYAVITSNSVLHSICEICGQNKAEMVTAGYIYLSVTGGGNGDG